MTLATNGLSVRLGGRPVLDRVNVTLAPGEVVGLLGPNGAGKSTLMRAMAGLVAANGQTRVDGDAIDGLASLARARRMAYLPQVRNIAWPMSVRNLVALGREPWRGSTQAARDAEACRTAMVAADVSELADRPATELSGGEQARVLLARALAQETRYLLADEPAAGLDPAHQMTTMQALRQRAALGTGIMVSLHDLTLAARWCDRLVVLDAGRIVAEGTPGIVLTAELLAETFGIAARVERDDCGIILVPTGLAGQRRAGT